MFTSRSDAVTVHERGNDELPVLFFILPDVRFRAYQGNGETRLLHRLAYRSLIRILTRIDMTTNAEPNMILFVFTEEYLVAVHDKRFGSGAETVMRMRHEGSIAPPPRLEDKHRLILYTMSTNQYFL